MTPSYARLMVQRPLYFDAVLESALQRLRSEEIPDLDEPLTLSSLEFAKEKREISDLDSSRDANNFYGRACFFLKIILTFKDQ